jgi:hypothetical protein
MGNLVALQSIWSTVNPGKIAYFVTLWRLETLLEPILGSFIR